MVILSFVHMSMMTFILTAVHNFALNGFLELAAKNTEIITGTRKEL